MKVLDKISEYDPSMAFKNWYGKILVNTAIDNYRKNQKYSDYLSISTITETEENEPEIEAELSANDILALYSYLPASCKVTFNLFEIEGYSHDEIGQMLGVTASTSRANLAKAKKMLRELYYRQFSLARKSNE